MDVANVSVIVPCYRAEHTIVRCVRSICEQTQNPKEIILINDASDDQTASVLAKLQSKYNDNFIKIITFKSNKGPASARNIGWELASSRFIAFLDADDVWHKDKLRIQYAIMLNSPTIDVTCHDTTTDEFDYHAFDVSRINTNAISFKQMLLKNKMPTRSVMLKRDIPLRFKSGVYYCEDYQLWLNILLEGMKVAHIPCILAKSFKNDFGDKGLSGNLLKMEAGVQSIFYDLYETSKISLRCYVMIYIYSKCKFIVRILRSALIRLMSL